MNLRDRPDVIKAKPIDKTINDMTISEFRSLPDRESWNIEVKDISSIVILPAPDGEELHDSEYRFLDFVAVNNDNKPICRLSGGSDVIHLNGIGGFGKNWGLNGIPTNTPVISWNMDCLPTSGLLRLWYQYKLTAGISLSSFELFIQKEKKHDTR